MSEDVIVTIDDVRAVTLCARGARNWFRANRLDFNLFLQEGLPASVLEATGDSLALKVVTYAKEKKNGKE